MPLKPAEVHPGTVENFHLWPSLWKQREKKNCHVNL
jgi:hypothetical protein